MQGVANMMKALEGEQVCVKKLRGVNRDIFNKLKITSTVDMLDGSTFDLAYADPCQLLQQLVHSSAELQDVYAQAANAHPCTREAPWSLVFACDEFTIGNQFSTKNNRKSMVTSYNFKEIGFEALASEVTWATPLIVRSVKISQAVGGWSRLLRDLLRRMLLGRQSMVSVGIPLILHGEPFLLFARFDVFISDADGIRSSIDWRGAASLRPCYKCRNVWKKQYGRGRHVDISCHDVSAFEPLDFDTLGGYIDLLLEASRRVDAGTFEVEQFKEMQQALGWNCNPHGWLADHQLRAVIDVLGVVRTDWFHNELADGVFTKEFALYCKAQQTFGTTVWDWKALLKADWQFPRYRRVQSRNLHRLFNEKTKSR